MVNFKYFKSLALSIVILFSFAHVHANTSTNLEQLFQKVNVLEERSPGLYKDMLERDAKKILGMGADAPNYLLSSYLSKLVKNIGDSYKAGEIDTANQKHELLQQLFHQVKPRLGHWIGITLVGLGKSNFVRWIYTAEDKFKTDASERFQAAEKIEFDKVNREPSPKSSYIARDTSIINARKKQPLTPQQLSIATSLSDSAYQHIAMYEEALKIKFKLKASQDEMSALAQEGLDLYHTANLRIQPNTLDRAYLGILMGIKAYLDKPHFSKFENEYNAHTLR